MPQGTARRIYGRFRGRVILGLVTPESAVAIKAVLDRLCDAAELEWEPSESEQHAIALALAQFKARGPDILDEVTPELWAYYRSAAKSFGETAQRRFVPPSLPETADIWSQVSFRFPPQILLGGRQSAPASVYISFEGDVTWEPEHGLQLVIDDGNRIGKLGPYDGHVTNAAAVGDDTLLGVVFRG